MEEKDLKQIKQIFREEFKTGFRESFAEIWDGNLELAFNGIHQEIEGVKNQISQSPTKSYLDDKIANLEGYFNS